MYENAAYNALAGRVGQSLICGPIVFAGTGFILGRMSRHDRSQSSNSPEFRRLPGCF